MHTQSAGSSPTSAGSLSNVASMRGLAVPSSRHHRETVLQGPSWLSEDEAEELYKGQSVRDHTGWPKCEDKEPQKDADRTCQNNRFWRRLSGVGPVREKQASLGQPQREWRGQDRLLYSKVVIFRVAVQHLFSSPLQLGGNRPTKLLSPRQKSELK